MIAAELSKISADAHIDEPHDLWFERMDADLRDRAPRRIQAEQDGGWSLVVDDSPRRLVRTSRPRKRAPTRRRAVAAAAPDVRLEMMRTDGVNAEIIYPTIGLYAWNIAGPDGRACRRASSTTTGSSNGSAGIERIRLAAMIPTWDVDMAIDEVQRVAAEPTSVGGLLLPLVGTPEWNLPGWEPLWAAIQETGIPAVMHQGTGHDMIFYRGWGSATANLLATQSMAPRAAALLELRRRARALPRSARGDGRGQRRAGWRGRCRRSTSTTSRTSDIGWTKPILAELPSHYLRRQVHATFQDDPVALHNIPFTGTDCLLWGNDYPHPESTYPELEQGPRRLLVERRRRRRPRRRVRQRARACSGSRRRVSEPVPVP